MQIIIPMTGYGSRFVAAGYKNLKPFIEVQGHSILEWIVKGMYPGERNFIFICRDEHLKQIVDMEQTLKNLAPNGKIYSIHDWEKKGPVNDVLRAESVIHDKEGCIINYCDFYMTWNYQKFCREAEERMCDGAIPCYSGFHPHLLPERNVYASCKKDQEDNLIEIREKYSFERDKTKACHSPGVYYFKNKELMFEYGQRLIRSRQTINNEYYASMIYNFMIQDGKRVWVPDNVEQFCQWGTPEDMEEYLFWTENIRGWDNEYSHTNGR